MKRIIAATDFSDNSFNAVEYAAALALSIKADLLILHVAPLPVLLNDIPIPFPGQADQGTEADLIALRNRLSHRTKEAVTIHTEIVQGNIMLTLYEYCEAPNVFALVMGSETAGWLQRVMEDATAVEAARNLHCPVLIVPRNKKFSPIRLIGLACEPGNMDGSFPAGAIAGIAMELGAELHILYASGEDKTSLRAGNNRMALGLSLLKQLQPSIHIIPSENIVAEIEKFAGKNGIDMLLLISRKHGLLHRIVNQDHLGKFLTDPSLPVITVQQQSPHEA